MPRRRRQRRTAAHEAPRASASACSCASASAAEARPRRCWLHQPVPAELTLLLTQGYDSWKLDLDSQLPTSAQEARDRTPWYRPARLQVLCKLALHVAPTPNAKPFISIDCSLPKLIGQRTELLNVRRHGLYHQHLGVGYRAAALRLGEHEGRRGISRH